MGNSCYKLLVTTFLLVLTAGGATTAFGETEFKKVWLLTGISLDIPVQWSVKTHEKNRSFAVADVAKEKKTLLLAHSLPLNATVSVSLGPKKKLTAAHLKSFTPERLAAIKAGLIKTMKQGENDGTPKIVIMHDPAVVYVSGHPALMSGYLRSGVSVQSETWEVVQFRIPRPDLDVNVSLSWRSDNDAFWSPIMMRVVNSLVIY